MLQYQYIYLYIYMYYMCRYVCYLYINLSAPGRVLFNFLNFYFSFSSIHQQYIYMYIFIGVCVGCVLHTYKVLCLGLSAKKDFKKDNANRFQLIARALGNVFKETKNIILSLSMLSLSRSLPVCLSICFFHSL